MNYRKCLRLARRKDTEGSQALFFTPVENNGVSQNDISIFKPVPIASTLHDLTDMAVAVKNIGPEEHIDEAVENPAPASFEFLTV